MAQKTFTTLDIGSSKIRALVCECNKEGRFNVLHVFETPSLGLRRGRVVDFNDLVNATGVILRDIKSLSRAALKNIILGLPSIDFKIYRSRGSVAVSRADLEISEYDVERVMEAARAIHVPHNRMLAHTITREFVVDGIGDIVDPLGMIGGKLEVDSLIVDLFSPPVKSLLKSIEIGGGTVQTMIFGSLASARSVLSKSQKDLGVMFLDMGHSITNLAVFEDGKLLHLASYPVGASHITNDLAIGLKSSIETAEKTKLTYGYAVSRNVSQKNLVDLAKLDAGSNGQFSRRFITEIIEARLVEILDSLNNELKSIGKKEALPAGVVVSGGGSRMPGLLDLIKKELGLPVQAAMSDISLFEFADFTLHEKLSDPEFSTLIGLALWRHDIMEGVAKRGFGVQNRWWKKILRLFTP